MIMKQSSFTIYAVINIVVLFLSIFCFYDFFYLNSFVQNINFRYFSILFLTVVSVYTIKAFRLYFLFAGNGIPFFKYLAVFAKTSFVNIVLPFKLGEIFRIYSFGNLLKDYFRGTSIVLLDRFIDTFALVIFFVFLNFIHLVQFEKIFFLLAGALGFLIILYETLPPILKFWNRYFIESKSSVRHLKELQIIRNIKIAYLELSTLLKGRSFAIFTLSLLSWIFEICSLLICGIFFDFKTSNLVADYLVSALLGNNFKPQQNFVIASTFFLILLYFFIHFFCILKKCFQFRRIKIV